MVITAIVGGQIQANQITIYIEQFYGGAVYLPNRVGVTIGEADIGSLQLVDHLVPTLETMLHTKVQFVERDQVEIRDHCETVDGLSAGVDLSGDIDKDRVSGESLERHAVTG